jgi:hypothetical protein
MEPLSDIKREYLIALGRITVNMNNLEQWTKIYIGQLLFPNVFYVLTQYPAERYGKILEIFDWVFHCKIIDQGLQSEFASIHGKLFALYQTRNKYIHSWWQFPEGDSLAKRYKFLKGHTIEPDIEPTVAELNQFADDLQATLSELNVFINKVAPLPNQVTA